MRRQSGEGSGEWTGDLQGEPGEGSSLNEGWLQVVPTLRNINQPVDWTFLRSQGSTKNWFVVAGGLFISLWALCRPIERLGHCTGHPNKLQLLEDTCYFSVMDAMLWAKKYYLYIFFNCRGRKALTILK
jgi:hypothetical protein